MSAWRDYLRLRRYRLARRLVGAACVAVFALVVYRLLILPPSTIVAAALETEAVSFRVTSPEASRIVLPLAARLVRDDSECTSELLIEPAVDTTVSYFRPRGGNLILVFAGRVSEVASKDAPARSLDSPTYVIGAEGECGAPPRIRLPIQGDRATFGAHQPDLASAKDVRYTLLSGKLHVYGRAQSNIGPFPIASRATRNALYASGELDLPGGTVIEEPETASNVSANSSPHWAGFADVVFGEGAGSDGGKSMTVAVSTNARTVTVYLPSPNQGASTRSSDPETVSLSTMARLVGDPHLQQLYALLGALLTGVGAFRTIRSFLQ